MMNLIDYAPHDFKEHLKVLDNKARFNDARVRCELGVTSNHQHYILTGNEGVGKSDAVQEISRRMVNISGIINCVTRDAISMFDINGGFEGSIASLCTDNKLIHIFNAERLGLMCNT
ncbi:MAG: hypothetical protein K2K03_07090, partial [Prevotella sp.]|nr:hypothetical protein [Prevotella sp.]